MNQSLRTTARRLRARLTYANVTSTLAVFLLLGTGTAYAAGSIGSKQVIDNSLRGIDIRNGTLTEADIADGRVGSAEVAGLGGDDVQDGSLTGDDLLDGSVNSNDVHGLVGADVVDDSLGSADVAALVGGDLEDGSLDGTELAGDSIDGSKVVDGSLASADLSAAARNQLQPMAYVSGGSVFVDTTATPGERQTVASKTVPAGSYAVFFAGDAYNASPTTARGFNCIVTVNGLNAGNVAGVKLGPDDNLGRNHKAFSITGVGSVPEPGPVKLECLSSGGEVSISGRLLALGISSIG